MSEPHPARRPAPSAAGLTCDGALQSAAKYVRLLSLPAAREQALLQALRERLAAQQASQAAPPSRAHVFAQLYTLLTENGPPLPGDVAVGHGSESDAALASLPARLQARFARMHCYVQRGVPRLPSMPQIRRAHMRPPRLDRNPARRLLRAIRGAPHAIAGRLSPQSRVQAATRLRQWLLLLLVFLPALAATAYMATVLPHKGGTWLEVSILASAMALFGWILVGFWAAVMGFFVRLFGDRHALDVAAASQQPLDCDARTAVLMPICDEDVTRAFAGVRAVYESLAATGQSAPFDFFILSDSRTPDNQVAEEVAWANLCEALDAHGRLFYRRRRTHLKRKNGNIADFCRRWGQAYRYMVILDADSLMTGDCLVRLAQLMQRYPDAGLIQTQPMAVNRQTAIARIQQFALRAYGPLFAAGLHFWHIDNAQYWGHNAIIRIAPFMAHCALPRLPGRGTLSGDILSHDFVEAALMRRGGWGVYLAYDLGGSYEEMPPTLLDELKRDRRWCKGNLQHMRLLFSDRLSPAHRALFANGVMAYASAFFWLLFLVLSSAEAAWEALRTPEYFPQAGSLFPQWPVWQPIWAMSLFCITLVVLFLPKVLGLVGIVLRGEVRPFGGPVRLLASAVLEIVFTTLIAPVRMLSHARFVFMTLLGVDVGWASQQRGDAAVGWGRALRYHGPGMLLASVWGVGLHRVAPGFTWWLAPILGPLLIAPAVTVYSSRPELGRRIAELGLFRIPEEYRPPSVLRRLRRILTGVENQPEPGFAEAARDPGVNALHCALMRHPVALSPPLRESRNELLAQALADGPHGLAREQKLELLADGAAMHRLHVGLWNHARPWQHES